MRRTAYGPLRQLAYSRQKPTWCPAPSAPFSPSAAVKRNYYDCFHQFCLRSWPDFSSTCDAGFCTPQAAHVSPPPKCLAQDPASGATGMPRAPPILGAVGGCERDDGAAGVCGSSSVW